MLHALFKFVHWFSSSEVSFRLKGFV